MSADVESFTTYFAVCVECHWEGPEHGENRYAAQRDVDSHVHDKHARESFQAALDAAVSPP